MQFAREQLSMALEWFCQVGVTCFNFSILEKKGMLAHDRPRSEEEVMRSLSWAGARNAAGGNVYMRPARFLDASTKAAWPVVFFDDVLPVIAVRIAKKYATLVIQTSPGRCHVWIACKSPLSESERAAVQAKLAPLIGADKASTSGEHFGRVPGFKNNKRNGVWTSVLTSVLGQRLDALVHVHEVGTTSIVAYPGSNSSPTGGRVTRSTVACVTTGFSESERDFGFALGRLTWASETGRDLCAEREYVIQQITYRSMNRLKRGNEIAARKYAIRTVQAVSRHAGITG